MEMVKVSGEVTLGLSLVAIDIDVGVVKLNNRDQGKSKKTVQMWMLEFLTQQQGSPKGGKYCGNQEWLKPQTLSQQDGITVKQEESQAQMEPTL